MTVNKGRVVEGVVQRHAFRCNSEEQPFFGAYRPLRFDVEERAVLRAAVEDVVEGEVLDFRLRVSERVASEVESSAEIPGLSPDVGVLDVFCEVSGEHVGIGDWIPGLVDPADHELGDDTGSGGLSRTDVNIPGGAVTEVDFSNDASEGVARSCEVSEAGLPGCTRVEDVRGEVEGEGDRCCEDVNWRWAHLDASLEGAFSEDSASGVEVMSEEW